MAYSVVFAAEVERDRDAVVAYLIDSLCERNAAARFLGELDAVIDVLEKLPESYPLVYEERLAAMGYRRASFMRYLALFKIDGDRVIITNVFHQSQDYARLV